MKMLGKRWLVIGGLGAVLLAPCAARVAGGQEVSAGGVLFIPDDKHGLYKDGYGGEVQYRYWLNEDWAVAVAVGVQRLNVESTDSKINGSAGRVDVYPVGASLVYDFIDYAPFRVLLEGGVRYLFVDSQATMVDVVGRQLDLKIDNGFTLVVGASAQYALTENLRVFGAVHYQYDPNGEAINTIYGPQRDNQFSSLLLQAGVSVNF